MNSKSNEHIITIRTLICGKIELKFWHYSIRQRKNRNLVELRITDGKKESGAQNQISFYGKNETEVKKKAKSYLQKEYAFGLVSDDEYTVSTWIMNYIETKQRDWSYRAQKTNMSYFQHYIDPMIGHIPLADFNTRHFQIFYDALKRIKNKSFEFKNINVEETPLLSTQYINKIAYFLHSAFEKAVDKEILVRNPIRTSLFDKAMAKKTTALPKRLFPDFYKAIQNSPYKNYYLFLLATAERRNEALAIRKRDVDEDTIIISLQLMRLKAGDTPTRDMIVVDKQLNRDGKMIYYVLVQPKWGSSRNIFITPFIRALLDEQLERNSKPLIRENNKQEFLFVNDEGRLYGESTIGKHLKKLLLDYKEKTNIDLTMFSLKSLRDTNASWLFGAHADSLVISRQLGHSNVNITNARYRDYIRNEDAENGYLRKKEALEDYIQKTIDGIESDN